MSNAFIATIKKGADTFRSDVAREKEMMEVYGFTAATSSGSHNKELNVLVSSQKQVSTVRLPDGKEGIALVKEWKSLSARLSTVRKFQSQEGISYGALRQLAELAEAAIAAQAEVVKGIKAPAGK